MPLMNFDKTVPYKRKSGIAGFFQLIFHNFFDLVMLNLLFVLTSLPLFTVGASLAALNKMTLRMVQDEPTSFCKEYFHYFKKFFKDGVISGLVFAAATGLSLTAFILYFDWAKQSVLLYALALIALIFFILSIMTALFYFPMLSCVDLKKTQLLKNALLLSIGYIGRSLPCLSVFTVFFVAIAALFPYSVPFIALGPISVTALAACYASWKPIQTKILTAPAQE